MTDCKTAKETWEKLEQGLANSSQWRKIDLFKQLVQYWIILNVLYNYIVIYEKFQNNKTQNVIQSINKNRF